MQQSRNILNQKPEPGFRLKDEIHTNYSLNCQRHIKFLHEFTYAHVNLQIHLRN